MRLVLLCLTFVVFISFAQAIIWRKDSYKKIKDIMNIGNKWRKTFKQGFSKIDFRQTSRLFTKGFARFERHDKRRVPAKVIDKSMRFKVFQKNQAKVKDMVADIVLKKRAFKIDKSSMFIYMTDAEKESYVGLRNLTELGTELETELPKKRGRPLMPPGRNKVRDYVSKVLPSFKKKFEQGVSKWETLFKPKKEHGKSGGNSGLGGRFGRSVADNPKKSYQYKDEDWVGWEKRQDTGATSLDLRDFNLVTEVKNQESCASCWVFGAIAVLEGAFALATGFLKPFSEQQTLHCNTIYGCKGGFWTKAWKQIRIDRYVALESDQPYTMNKNESLCLKDTPNGLTDIMNVGSYEVMRELNQEEKMIGYLSTYGPVAVVINATDTLFYYESGVIDVCLGGKNTGNHLVTLVGYDAGSLLMKNSWGVSWGEGGYFKVRRGCGPSLTGYSYWASYLSVVSLVSSVETPYISVTTVHADEIFTLQQKRSYQVLSKNLAELGVLASDVYTLKIADGLTTLSKFFIEFLHADENNFKNKVYRLVYNPYKNKCQQMTVDSTGVLKSASTSCTMSPGTNLTIEILITPSGYSVDLGGTQLPHYIHFMPIDLITNVKLYAYTKTSMFDGFSLTRTTQELRDTSGLVVEECVDLDSYCAGYLEKDAKACDTSEWMVGYCPKSCGTCLK